jgi:hypothetical protein
MASLDDYEDIIAQLVQKNHWTHRQVADYVQVHFGIERGASERTVRRFCDEHHISGTVSDGALSLAVTQAIEQVFIHL